MFWLPAAGSPIEKARQIRTVQINSQIVPVLQLTHPFDLAIECRVTQVPTKTGNLTLYCAMSYISVGSDVVKVEGAESGHPRSTDLRNDNGTAISPISGQQN